MLHDSTYNVLSIASLPSTFDCSLIFSEVDESSGKTCPVGNTREQELGSLIKLILETFLSDDQYVGHICHPEEVFHVMKTVGLGVSIG